MIHSFRDSDTESVFQRRRVGKFSNELQRQAQRKLGILNSAIDLNDLRAPPGNRLERLVGDRQGQHSIRVNDQWRICFSWISGDAWNVELTDYH
ncbi:MAG: type II toxin-antitoxin system RelE/ParE family toxin [Chloroflexi bacterium]|nr:type II toxin-antitoxin system RelE/ParE family toxin [Chloroflexota bacterium]